MRCQTALIVSRAIPPDPAALLMDSAGRKELSIREMEGEVRRGKDRVKHGRGRNKNNW